MGDPVRITGLRATALALSLGLPALAGCGGGGEAFDRPIEAGSPAGGSAGDPARPMTGPPLRFLPVTAVAPGACADGAGYTLRTSSDTTCLTTTEEDGMRVTRLVTAKSGLDPVNTQGGWKVEIELADRDATAFAELTRELATRTPPTNQLAIVRGDRALSAPAVPSAITGGKLEITGSFDRSEAEGLARDLGGA
ncbi:SecDF P1 head subdomain-containing protein [Streptomyces palmae]|uniref:SecDF P1 head subdomain domain-containing protein n=1 Tax=Streptomyces palmae TaxID=1701085 RepID=A0A4Z0GXD0_9ACTN|nr:hypothetical protein [Streptomyces palmae]TGB01786.1 hypothetical protein E4099_20860 [Streptomyces palmae]